MVAYSFQKQFVEPILSGSKRQTIRAERRRHARPGEQLQLYTGMRTRHCKLIGRAQCASVSSVVLSFGNRPSVELGGTRPVRGGDALDLFATSDGFQSWHDLEAFWRLYHPGIETFEGVLIRWAALQI